MHFIGHADNQRLSARAKKIYQTNVGLSNYRAATIATYFQQQLLLAQDSITTEGKGSSMPIASNDNKEGMAKNRRVELVAWYDEEIVNVADNNPPLFIRSNICEFEKVDNSAFSVTLDGQPLDVDHTANDADQQRCTDVALNKAALQLTYDNLTRKPALNATAVVRHNDGKVNVSFLGYSNYSHFITKAEIRVFNAKVSSQSEPAFIINLNQGLSGVWQVEESLKELLNKPLSYRLRIYDKNNQFDETQTQNLTLQQQTSVDLPVSQALLSGYGHNNIAIQNIALSGGTLTVNGKSIPNDHHVYFLGQPFPKNDIGEFVTQQIMPEGKHHVEVAILNEHGNGQLFQRHLSLKSNDWFYVGMADLTLGKNKTSGSIDLANNEHHFDNDLFIDGHIAFYAKGKWQNKYTITTSIDSKEEPIEDIFSNFNKKDPSSLLRRLDEANHYSVYGDDSTVEQDAPTQGRIYVKVNDDKSHLMWGNFIADIEDTELSRIERGLYGANLEWNSQSTTTFGEQVSNINLFAAESGTNAAYEELRGTGGSLYYLQHQDITQGSERITIEVRDKDSGLVLSSTPLVAGSDYDVDSLQGRVLLTSPLSSVSSNDMLIRTNAVTGHPTFLVINYEYTPGFDSIEDLAIGGRASYWLNDALKFGITGSKQEMGNNDHKLKGLDITYRYSAQSYIKLEAAQTSGQGISTASSNNGGFHYKDKPNTTLNDSKADAYRLESGILFKDLGFENNGKASVYWQDRQKGYSGIGQFSQYDTEQAGFQVNLPISTQTNTSLRIDSRNEDGGIDKLSGELNLSHQLNELWQLNAGIRTEDTVPTDESLNQNFGERTDLALQLNYQVSDLLGTYAFIQQTLNHDDTKLANDRFGLGVDFQLSDTFTLSGELSDGNQGFGAQVGTDYQYDDASNIYLNYELDPDRTDSGLAGRNGQLVSGARHRFSDSLSVYGEERYQHGSNQIGLLHAYGVEYVPSEKWVLGLSIESGEQEDSGQETLKRNAIAVNAGYASERFKYGTALEYRKDEQSNEQRESYLVRNNLSYKVNPDWRAQIRIDFAISNSSTDQQLNSDYSEALIGFAYRPVNNDKLNALVTYNYLYDLAPAEQFTSNNQQNDYQQRSHVFAFDANYDITQRWTLGAKYAYKLGEVRQGREQGDWYDSSTDLYIVRADWHVIRNWDFLIEARMLSVKEAQDKRKGFLTAIHHHFGQNLKVGIGYNFTDFSDDLTNLDYDAKGWFLNLVGKI